MARAHYRDMLLSATTDPRALAGATVWVREVGTVNPIAATMYAGPTGGTTVANPITTGTSGEVAFYLDVQQDADLYITHPDYAARTVTVHVDGDAGDEVLKTGTQTITGQKTLASPILTTPTINGGTQSSPTLTTPTLTTPTINGGTITDTVLGGLRSASARVLEIVGTAMLLRSPDGTKALSLSNAGEFSAPGLLRRYYVVNVEDEGLTYGTSTSLAAGNKTAWAAMLAKYVALGHPVDFHINDTLPMDGGINLHHGTSNNWTFNLIGKPGRSGFQWHNAAGSGVPYLDLGNSAANKLDNCHIIDIAHNFTVAPTDAPTIRVGLNCTNLKIERNHFRDGGSGLASLYAIEAKQGVEIRNCKINVRGDSATLAAGGLFPAGILCSADSGGPIAGAIVRDTTCDGDNNTATSRSDAIRFTNTVAIDNPRLLGVHFKGHAACIRKEAGAGGILHATIAGDSVFDSCAYGFFLEPDTGAGVASWVTESLEILATSANVWARTTSGGTLDSLQWNGGIWKSATVVAALFGAGVNRVQMLGVDVDATGVNTGGNFAVDVNEAAGAGAGHRFLSNYIICGSSASGAFRMSTAASPFTVTGNVWRGVTASIPATTAAKINEHNAFLA